MAMLTPPLVGAKYDPTSHTRDAASRTGSGLLLWIGLAFVVMGGTDILLAWYPAGFGKPEWEFGAISATLNGLALPTLGLYFVLGACIAREYRTPVRVVAVAMFLLAAALIVLALLYATVVPLALGAVAENAEISRGMQKAVIKASVLFVTYIALFVTGAVVGWRSRRTA